MKKLRIEFLDVRGTVISVEHLTMSRRMLMFWLESDGMTILHFVLKKRSGELRWM